MDNPTDPCTCVHPLGAHTRTHRDSADTACTLCKCEGYTKPGSMRAIYNRLCDQCGHTWTAPSPTGNCTKCHSPRTTSEWQSNSGLKRV